MKKIYSLMLVAVSLGLAQQNASATVWTVSNNPDRPAQYTGIQAAVDAASPNDTILITGGTYSGSVDVVIPLVFYGEAIAGPDFPVTYLTGTLSFKRFNNSLSSSGSRVYGMRLGGLSFNGSFSGYAAGQRVLEDYIIERCHLATSTINVNDGISNITYRNCLLKDATHQLNASAESPIAISNIIYTNNVFEDMFFTGYSDGLPQYGDMNGAVLMRNNVFIDQTTSGFGGLSEIILENNIFYRSEPTGLTGSTFNNNISYLCNNNALPYGNNIGGANIENTDPLFANYPALGGVFSFDHDYSLEAGSPGIGTGTNGTDIGINGGNAPVANLYKYAKIPAVTELNIPVSSVPVGGTLQIEIQAVSRD